VNPFTYGAAIPTLLVICVTGVVRYTAVFTVKFVLRLVYAVANHDDRHGLEARSYPEANAATSGEVVHTHRDELQGFTCVVGDVGDFLNEVRHVEEAEWALLFWHTLGDIAACWQHRNMSR
jgi:hypothetical protein